MGFNTSLLILNDGWHDIEAHPEEFIEKVGACVKGGLSPYNHGYRGPDFGVSLGVGSHANCVQVMTVEHADITNLLLVGGNYGTVVGRAWTYRHHEREHIINAMSLALATQRLDVVDLDKGDTSALLLEETCGFIAQMLDTGLEDNDWPALRDLYERISDHLHPERKEEG